MTSKKQTVGVVILLFIFGVFLLADGLSWGPRVEPPEFISKYSREMQYVIKHKYEDFVRLKVDLTDLRYIPYSSLSYIEDGKYIYKTFPDLIRVEGADLKTFEVFDLDLVARDKNNIYIDGVAVPGIENHYSFRPLSKYSPYYYTTKHVYHLNGIRHSDGSLTYELNKISADVKTLRDIDGWIVADDTHVYIDGKVVPGLDGKTFKKIDGPYFTDKNGTHYLNDLPASQTLRFSSSSDIKIIVPGPNGGLLQIGNQIFLGTTTMNVDISTFKVFGIDGYTEKPEACTHIYQCPYSVDKNNVYYNAKVIPEADTATFTLIGYGVPTGGKGAPERQPNFGKDKNYVYYQGKIVPNADPNTFTPLSSGGYYLEYGRDSKDVYWRDSVIIGADPATFEIFPGQQPYEGCGYGTYGKDRTSVFHENKKVEGADPKTFKPMLGGGDYGEDANGFYHNGNKIDKAQFKVCEYG